MNIPRYAVIPTHNRPFELTRLVDHLRAKIDVIIVIDNASEEPVRLHTQCDSVPRPHDVRVIRDEEQPPNLYRLWNRGINLTEFDAREHGYDRWDVFIFNDDAVLLDGWCDAVASKLRHHDVVATSTGIISSPPGDKVWRAPRDGGRMWRLCPWAFVMRGESGLRADERFHWWFGDDDFDWSARLLGGIAVVGGPVIINERANQSTVGQLAERAGKDEIEFRTKWGSLPW